MEDFQISLIDSHIHTCQLMQAKYLFDLAVNYSYLLLWMPGSEATKPSHHVQREVILPLLYQGHSDPQGHRSPLSLDGHKLFSSTECYKIQQPKLLAAEWVGF